MNKPGAVRIAMWSGPRNISTALLRAFENRPDCVVWDEPFYAPYLAETGLNHPMAAAIIAAYETDWRKVAARAVGPIPGGKALFYQKHMTHHLLPHMALDWLDGVANAFLIRDPARVLPSYLAKRDEVTLEDLGLPQQQRLFDWLRARTGQTPPVLDADDVLADPGAMLGALCRALGIAFDAAMLSWPAGRRDSDGLWAAHWYGAVEKSSHFMAPGAADQGAEKAPPPGDPPARRAALLAAADGYYQALRPPRRRPA
ncbi:MAG: HAD family hydrolase [Proteobacteria bacterium]|nr:HAD family hydrolase [Pseudomonadota bacterium]